MGRKTMLAGAVALAALAVLAAAALAGARGSAPQGSATAAGEPFKAVVGQVTIDGVQGGEGSDATISVLGFTTGATQVAATGTVGSALKSKLDLFTIAKGVDAASPKLALYTLSGQHIKQVVIEIFRPGTRKTYMTFKLADVLVSSDKIGDSGAASDVPLEQISFNFAKIAFEYTSNLSKK